MTTARQRLAAVDAALDALAWSLAYGPAVDIVADIRDDLDRLAPFVEDADAGRLGTLAPSPDVGVERGGLESARDVTLSRRPTS